VGEPTVTDYDILVACHHVLQINTHGIINPPYPPDRSVTGSRKQVLLGQSIRIGAYWTPRLRPL